MKRGGGRDDSGDEDFDNEETMAMASPAALECYQCGATSTPQWREGPQGPKTLCNACGVKYYRQAKRTRKTASERRTAQQQRQHRAPPSKHSRGVTGDSGDELTATYCVMSDHSEDSEEQLAALSLLCFAGATAPQQHQQQQQRDHLECLEGDDELDGPDEPAPAQLFHASGAATTVSAPASASASASASAAMTTTLGFLATQLPALPATELSCVQQLQAAVQQAFREVQAADAATHAVAQFLAEKEVQAHCARERARMAERMLLEQMRQLDRQYQLTKQQQEP